MNFSLLVKIERRNCALGKQQSANTEIITPIPQFHKRPDGAIKYRF
jgi:hypothetical protein